MAQRTPSTDTAATKSRTAAKQRPVAKKKQRADRPAQLAPVWRHRGNPLFALRTSKLHGTGAFALRAVKKGTRLVEYRGERVWEDIANSRYDDDATGNHHTFLFDLGDGTVLDASVGGNEARFLNHSCAPNCEPVIVRKHIYIDAIADILPGTELLYDYGYDIDGMSLAKAKRIYPCRCGAVTCRGTIVRVPPPKKKKPRARAPRG